MVHRRNRGTAASLQILDLCDNSLTGSLSDAIGGMSRLEYVSFGNNKLSGSLPASIGNLTDLRIIDIADNAFEGGLPDVFGGMGGLESVRLENNRFTGHVPPTLKQAFDGGAEIFFTNNYMTGDTLSAMPNNLRNFADHAIGAEYRLTLPAVVRIGAGVRHNIWADMGNSPVRGAAANKPLLPPESYGYTVLNDPQGKLDVTRDANGIYVSLGEGAAEGGKER